ncbi:MAG: hypothetical protein NT080_01880 [Spirochaetes bacterium]|nr:hypothetical protein [Spirochaetota bacterium]
MDGIHVQLVRGTDVAFQARESASPGSTITLSLDVPSGTFSVLVFAVEGDVITGIAVKNDVVLAAAQTTTLSLTMSPISFYEPSNQYFLGPGDPSAQPVSRSVSGIPPDFWPYLLSGTPRLRAKLNSLPNFWDDAPVDRSASSEIVESTLDISGSVPAGTALGNEQLYYWFVVSWPGSSAVLSDALPADASCLVYDGATLSGNVTGDSMNDEFGMLAVEDVDLELNQGGPAIYTAITDPLGNFVFGSANAGTYNAELTLPVNPRWGDMISSADFRLDSGTWSSLEIYSYPTMTYEALILSPGVISVLDFRFDGY